MNEQSLYKHCKRTKNRSKTSAKPINVKVISSTSGRQCVIKTTSCKNVIVVQSEEEVAEALGEPTMEEYMMKTQDDYGSRIARPKIDEKAHFELKGQFLKELRDNTFSGSDNDDANEHIEKVLD
ncbi:hypothetical protein Tco_0033845 [Tanacetum coccineum]